MSAYKEWAKRNWPICTAVDDPDRFVEFSQADLDAYAEKAFAAGARAPRADLDHWAHQLGRALRDEACALQRVDALSFKLKAYRIVAGLGWAAAVAAAWYWG